MSTTKSRLIGAIGAVLVASLMVPTPGTAAARVEAPPRPKAEKPVPVSAVKSKSPAAASPAASAPDATLPKPSKPGRATSEPNSWSKPVAGVELRPSKGEAALKATIERIGTTDSSSTAGLGPVFEISANQTSPQPGPSATPVEPTPQATPSATQPAPDSTPSIAQTSPEPEPSATASAPTDEPTETDGGGALANTDVRVDYSTWAGAIGGGWSDRLRLVLLEDCTDGPKVECETATPLKTKNDPKTGTLTAATPKSMNASTMMVAASAAPSGPSGDYSASPLAPSSSWAGGNQSGDFTWSYPLQVPPGINGPEPDLAIDYSSGSVDGRTSSTNNQTSWIGEGFSLDPGHIERSYEPCRQVDGAPDDVGDLCWRDDHLSITLNGKSSTLIEDGSSNQWRMKADDGTRIQRVTKPGQNAAQDGEHWVVTTLDGTKYYYGLNKRWDDDDRRTDSVSVVPVYGARAGDPCHASTYAASSCSQAWRWSLDYVVDPNGNTMSMFWGQESNSYGANDNDTVRTYDRAPLLKSIEYGTRHGSSANAPSRVVFTAAERCDTTADFDCTGLKESNAAKWPDVPYDQICSSETSCADRTSPTFFSRKRLTTITTQILGADNEYSPVNEWKLGQSFANTHEDSTDPDNPSPESRTMTLESIQQTGKVGSDITLPAIRFTKRLMDNRVENNNGLPTFRRFRVNAINNGTGGSMAITYSPIDCTRTSVPAENALDSNGRRCFPVWFPGPNNTRQLEFFHKYRVNSVSESDNTGGGLTKQTVYGYSGGDSWRYTDSTIDEEKYRTWNDWRGYANVSTTVGVQSEKTYQHSLYMRGMNGDRTHSGGKKSVFATDGRGGASSIPDDDEFAGFLRRTRTELGNGGALVEEVINAPKSSAEPTAKSDDGREAKIVRTAVTATFTPLASGGERVTRVRTAYNTVGLPVTIDDEGDAAVSTDSRCTTIDYAVSVERGMYEYPAREVTKGLPCATAATSSSQIIDATQTAYDGGSVGSAPTEGNITRVDVADGWNGAVVYKRDSSAAYDSYGRPTVAVDAMSNRTATEYSPATGPVRTITTTNPLGQDTAKLVNRAWATPDRVTNVAGFHTDTSYDALGRITSIWGPDRTQGTDTPSAKFAYDISTTRANSVTSERINPAGDYVKSVAFFDGFMRERGTQSPSANGDGRVITETNYDDRGWVSDRMGPYYTTGPVDTTLYTGMERDIPTYTLYGYDRAGRIIRESLASHGSVKWSTLTAHEGDRTRVTPPEGETATVTIHDARGQTTTLAQFLSAAPSGTNDQTKYTYTAGGQLATVTDPLGTKWTKTYDIRGRLVSEQDPDKGSTSYTYDDLDRQVTSTDARGVTLWTGYDALGRKTELRDDTQTGTLRSEWTYDSAVNGTGHPTSSTRYADGESYTTEIGEYDAAGRPLKSKVLIPESEGLLHQPGGHLFGYAYNPDGTVKTAEQPLVWGIQNEDLRYTYDALGNVDTFRGSGHFVSDTIRYSTGEVSQRTLGSVEGKKAYAVSDYDAATKRLTRQRYSLQGTATTNRLDLNYGYDQAGNVTSIKDFGADGARRECFDYDYLRRLTQAWTTTTTNCADPTDSNFATAAPYLDTYTYAKNGNRTKVVSKRKPGSTVLNSTETLTYPAATAARPHAATQSARTGSGAATETFTYDQVGSLAKRSTTTTNGKQYEWDREGRVKSVKDTATGKVIEYLYDADGNRLIERDGTDNSTTLYLGTAEVTVKDDTRSTVRTYTLDDVPVATRDKNGIQLVGANHQNTPVITSSATSQALTKRRFSPFGEALNAPSWPSERGFLNKQVDASVGTVHVGAREYDPSDGRFLSVDPIADFMDPQQMNGYAYANNTPVTQSDPTGQFAESPNGNAATAARLRDMVDSNKRSRAGWRASDDRGFVPRSAPSHPPQWLMDSTTHMRGCFAGNICPTASGGPSILERLAEGIWESFTFKGSRDACGSDLTSLSCAGNAGFDTATTVASIFGVGLIAKGGKAVISAVRTGTTGASTSSTAGTTAARACSFSSATLVLMADGSKKRIDTVTEGDRVVASDPETGDQAAKRVEQVFVHADQIVELRTSQEVIRTTDDHPFWSESLQRFVRADSLAPGDQLLDADGLEVAVLSVATSSGRREHAYNLSVEGIHTFHVGRGEVLVHNICAMKPVNLPAWKKVSIDMEHILSGHVAGGKRVSPLKDLFPDSMTPSQIESTVRQAYRGATRLATQGDRVKVSGSANDLNLEMWVNRRTRTIETAYPVGAK